MMVDFTIHAGDVILVVMVPAIGWLLKTVINLDKNVAIIANHIGIDIKG